MSIRCRLGKHRYVKHSGAYNDIPIWRYWACYRCGQRRNATP